MTKTSQDNNLNHIYFSKHFYEYLAEKLKYRDLNNMPHLKAFGVTNDKN